MASLRIPADPVIPPVGTSSTVAESLLCLVQAVADRGADAQGWPRRQVPRLDDDRGLADQLTVVAEDLIDAGSPALESVAQSLDEVRRAL